MALQQDVVSGSAGLGAWFLSWAGYIEPIVAILVGAASLVALVYSIRLKRKQIRYIDGKDSSK